MGTFCTESVKPRSEFDTLDSYFVRASLDHLVGPGEQAIQHGESEGFRCLEVDHQFKPCRLYNRQLSGFGPFEDLRCVDAHLAKPLGIVACIADQSTDLHKFTLEIHRWIGCPGDDARQDHKVRSRGRDALALLQRRPYAARNPSCDARS